MVVFEDGLPRKSEYRRFAVRSVDGQDDVASMHEVITRRFRGSSTSAPSPASSTPPDTALDDGGGSGPC